MKQTGAVRVQGIGEFPKRRGFTASKGFYKLYGESPVSYFIEETCPRQHNQSFSMQDLGEL